MEFLSSLHGIRALERTQQKPDNTFPKFRLWHLLWSMPSREKTNIITITVAVRAHTKTSPFGSSEPGALLPSDRSGLVLLNYRFPLPLRAKELPTLTFFDFPHAYRTLILQKLVMRLSLLSAMKTLTLL